MKHALSALVSITSLVALAACGGGGAASTSPTPETSPSPIACTSSGHASADWPAAESRSANGPAPLVSAAVSGDTLKLTFDKGTPAYELRTQSSAHFTTTDGRGGPVDLSGSAGVLIVLRGLRGDMANYAGQKAFTAQGSTLVEVREIGDFEGVIGWAAGLKTPGCASVTSGASTLTFKFRSS